MPAPRRGGAAGGSGTGRARAPRGAGGASRGAAAGLTVAVTGPTGEIGKPFVSALERSREVGRIVGMARRPFDPAAHGWRKTEYRQGDVLDRGAVDGLVDGADVVVHLAFIVVRASSRSRDINVEGSRNVFQATVAAGAERLVYSSLVAAYGFPAERDGLLTEDMPARGHDRFPYSAHKAEVERVLAEALAGTATDAYVVRPCIVAGPQAPALVNAVPHVRLLRPRLRGLVRPLLVLPDPGVPFQLVHHDDVALALRAAVLGRGAPGVYNLAGPGEIRMRELAAALGVRSVPVPQLAIEATAQVVARTPFLPAEAAWIEAARRPVLMDTAKARRELRWRPRHDAHETLRQTVEAAGRGG
jgi:UDP-glucose 4-epimerase